MTQLLLDRIITGGDDSARRGFILETMTKTTRFLTGLMLAALLLAPGLSFGEPPAPPLPQPRIDRAETLNTALAPTELAPVENPASPADSAADIAGASPETAPPAAAVITAPPQPVSLSAKIVENGPIISNGVVWRVFATKTDESGQLPLLFKSEDATASLALIPGEYAVHVAYGRSQASDTLKVVMGPNVKTVVLDAGALRLRSEVSGDIPIQDDQLRFDIFTSGADEARVPVALDVKGNTLIHLNAGIYSVVSRWGKTNATVRADLRVEPGQVTDATLFHRAAQITFKLVSNPGGEAIADVEWSVKDASRQTIFGELGAFPLAILAQGDYEVVAKAGDAVYNRAFQVSAGSPREIEVLTTVY